jgi:hypothetical protein
LSGIFAVIVDAAGANDVMLLSIILFDGMKMSRLPSPLTSPHAKPPFAAPTTGVAAGPAENVTSWPITVLIPRKRKNTPAVSDRIKLFILPPDFFCFRRNC